MNCWLTLFHLCVFDPSSVYVAGDVSTQLAGNFGYVLEHSDHTWHITHPTVGHLELGVDVELTRSLALRYGIAHESVIGLGDRGQERAFIGFTWRPFKR